MGLIARIERPMFHEKVNEIEMPFANRKMKRRRVVILTAKQRRTALDQFLHALQVAIPACAEHVPDIRCCGNDSIMNCHGTRSPHLSKLNHWILLFRKSENRKLIVDSG